MPPSLQLPKPRVCSIGLSARSPQPRFLRVRDDKGPEDSTNAAQVAQMYNDQDVVKNQKGGAKDFDDDDW